MSAPSDSAKRMMIAAFCRRVRPTLDCADGAICASGVSVPMFFPGILPLLAPVNPEEVNKG
jgi:hypothetical protein